MLIPIKRICQKGRHATTEIRRKYLPKLIFKTLETKCKLYKKQGGKNDK